MKQKKPEIVVSDKKGRIYNLPDLEAVGMKGGLFFNLALEDLLPLPSGSELFMLPQRRPVGYDTGSKSYIEVKDCFAAAAFVSPGYTVTYSSAYIQGFIARLLPLFSYAAVCFYRRKFYAACVRVDRQRRQDLRLMDIDEVRRNAAGLKKHFRRNRLIVHLERCALKYGCPAAKNFFLGRYEAPLPSSPFCNARCLGCISHQPGKRCSVTQPRIKFVPYPEEIAEVALLHLERVADALVSFGQGCEGEPLLAGETLEKAIRLIRRCTRKGIINLNTNASRPRMLTKLFDAGLDSIRVSMNSVRESYYSRYFRPRKYSFNDVKDSIKTAIKKEAFVSVNYLTMPGFTDLEEEFAALKDFIGKYRINMIQWRNMNFDPREYFCRLKIEPQRCDMLGIREVIASLKKNFPGLLMGYFNPSKSGMR